MSVWWFDMSTHRFKNLVFFCSYLGYGIAKYVPHVYRCPDHENDNNTGVRTFVKF